MAASLRFMVLKSGAAQCRVAIYGAEDRGSRSRQISQIVWKFSLVSCQPGPAVLSLLSLSLSLAALLRVLPWRVVLVSWSTYHAGAS